MLIEFRVTNFRSIRETQVFSMVASKDGAHVESSCIETGIPAIPRALRSAILYGPNASGKSNLISALGFMRSMVETSAISVREGQLLPVTPFRFDLTTVHAPSEFEVTFLENGIRYQYGFALTATRVVREWLLVYVERKAQRWFEREYDAEKDQYNWYIGTHLIGGNQRHVWKDSTRSNALFLSVAVNLNSEQLRSIFNWFTNKLIVIVSNQPLQPSFTADRIADPIFKSHLIQFLQAADLGIQDVTVIKEKKPGHNLQVNGLGIALTSQEINTFKVKFLHQGKEKPAELDFGDQSHGTQRLFSYAAPVLDVLENGKTLVIDELDSSLHTKMVRFLVGLMHAAAINKNDAQLIFTSHNTSLLDTDLFRRDQIWFIEKNNESASQLYPLTDFSPRKGEALEKGYLIGRYGALPFFGEFNL